MTRFIQALVLLGVSVSLLPAQTPDRPYLEAALKAARWLRSVGRDTPEGRIWPTAPDDSPASVDHLYSGNAGVVLFLLELGLATKDDAWIREARRGADALVARMGQVQQCSLYTGLAGIGFVLGCVHQGTGDRSYREAALKCVTTIHERAREVGKGVAWNDTTDIIRGGAGIGLFLLHAGRELDHEPSVKLAERAGQRLLELARKEKSGLSWAMTPTYQRRMPNFSHGTAGVSYFLASLHRSTGKKEYLDAALAGARHLIALADRTDDGFKVHHHAPGGEKLFYLGWCHGPPGTARLFHQLYQITGDRSWHERVEQCGRTVRQAGVPEKRAPGFWNNAGQCCGDAGVAEFFLSLHGETKDEKALELAHRLARDILTRGEAVGDGLRWIQAEHRVRPRFLQAQTGYMQGAAGIGLLFLHLDAIGQGRTMRSTLPDVPW